MFSPVFIFSKPVVMPAPIKSRVTRRMDEIRNAIVSLNEMLSEIQGDTKKARGERFELRGRGSRLVHQLEKLEMIGRNDNLASRVHRKRLPSLPELGLSHSKDYLEKLGLTETDFQRIQELQWERVIEGKTGFMRLESGFSFCLKATLLHSGWTDMIQVVADNPRLNRTQGKAHSTDFINVVSPQVHKRIVAELDEDKKERLRSKIDSTLKEREKRWALMTQHSEEYCERLGLLEQDIEEIGSEQLELPVQFDGRKFSLFFAKSCRKGIPPVDVKYQNCQEISRGGWGVFSGLASEELHKKILGQLDLERGRWLKRRIALFHNYSNAMRYARGQRNAPASFLVDRFSCMDWKKMSNRSLSKLILAITNIYLFNRRAYSDECLKQSGLSFRDLRDVIEERTDKIRSWIKLLTAPEGRGEL